MARDPLITICRLLAATEVAVADPGAETVRFRNELSRALQVISGLTWPTRDLLLRITESAVNKIDRLSSPEQRGEAAKEALCATEALWAALETSQLLAAAIAAGPPIARAPSAEVTTSAQVKPPP